MLEKLKIAVICLLILIVYGIAGEIDYQDELATERYVAVYYAGLK